MASGHQRGNIVQKHWELNVNSVKMRDGKDETAWRKRTKKEMNLTGHKRLKETPKKLTGHSSTYIHLNSWKCVLSLVRLTGGCPCVILVTFGHTGR